MSANIAIIDLERSGVIDNIIKISEFTNQWKYSTSPDGGSSLRLFLQRAAIPPISFRKKTI